MSHARQANLLGATAVAVAGRIRDATEAALGHGASAPAALVALRTFLGGAPIDALSRVLGISHSGTVRLVDRLAAAGLVERRVGADARAVSLRLTPEGSALAVRLEAERRMAVEEVLSVLGEGDRDVLTGLLERLLAGMATDRAAARHLCRLCDVTACGHPDTCPVTQAVPHQLAEGSPAG